jgi:hypothetical protein
MNSKILTTALFCTCLLFIGTGCQKEENLTTNLSNVAISNRTICGQVNYTAPSTVNVGEPFTITALVSCGRIAIDRGYILASDMITRIYVGLICSTPGLLWEEVVQFQCASNDAMVNVTLNTSGTYVYRTRHNQTASGPCGGSANNCSGFTGNQFCCFGIEAINPCDIQIGDYFTYSQGFYLNAPPGLDFMEDHLDLFPIIIGCDDGTTTTYATPQSINDLETGAPNGLRNQLITLILNAGINEDFGCLVVVEDACVEYDDDDVCSEEVNSAFVGMTVDELIALANDVYGGCTAEPAGLAALLDAINLNFHLGAVNNGVLTCCE